MEMISIPYLAFRKTDWGPPYMWVCQVMVKYLLDETRVKLLYFTLQADVNQIDGKFTFSGYKFTKPEDSKYYISNLNAVVGRYVLVHAIDKDVNYQRIPDGQLEEYADYINRPIGPLIIADRLIRIVQTQEKWYMQGNNTLPRQ